MKNGDLAAIVLREIEQATGGQDALGARRERNLRLFRGELPEPPAAAGRSVVVSMDVQEGINALMAQLDPVLRTSMVSFEPAGAQDVAQARLESDAVRRSIERAAGASFMADSVQDALILANGWLFARLDDYTENQTITLPAELVTPEAMASLPEEVEVEHGEDTVTLSQAVERQRLVIESVPPEQMIYSNEQGISPARLDELRLVGRKRAYTVADLRRLKIPQDLIDATPNASEETTQQARSGESGESEAAQEGNQLKAVTCCFLMEDTGAGQQERREVWMGGENVLLDEPAPFLPYVTGCAIPLAHRIDGISVAELLDPIQCAKTETLRQFLDNLAALNASRLGVVDGQVNMGDLLNGRVNGVVRMAMPGAVMPLPAADIGPQAMAGMSYLDSIRSSRIGAALDATEVQAQLMSASATAAAGQLAKVELMAGWFASNLVETLLKPLYLLVHKILKGSNQAIQLSGQGGEWKETQPNQWPARQIAEVTMGLTTAQRAQRQLALSQVLAQQQQALQAGPGVLVDTQRMYNAAVDWLAASDLQDPSRYLIDPASPESRQASQANAQSAQQQQAQQVALVQQEADKQRQFELIKQERELEYKRWSDLLEAETKEAQLTQAGISEVLRLRQQGRENESAREERREQAQETRRAEFRKAQAGVETEEPGEPAEPAGPGGGNEPD